jgi:hypothetical protein
LEERDQGRELQTRWLTGRDKKEETRKKEGAEGRERRRKKKKEEVGTLNI